MFLAYSLLSHLPYGLRPSAIPGARTCFRANETPTRICCVSDVWDQVTRALTGTVHVNLLSQERYMDNFVPRTILPTIIGIACGW